MFDAMVVLVTAFYISLGDHLAILRLRGDNEHALDFLLLHSPYASAATSEYEFLGNAASPKIEVEDRDTLVLVARRKSIIVASQVFEVDTTLVEQGYLLVPRGGYNVLCDQVEQLRESELVPTV